MRAWIPATALALVVAAACSAERAPFLSSSGVGAGLEKDAGPDSFLSVPDPTPPSADAAGYCGNLVVPIVLEHPNLYFVIDASGSMNLPMDKPNSDGFLPTRYVAARQAIGEVLKAVGHRVSYGAAIFPAQGADEATCEGGEEIFHTRKGDPVSYAVSGDEGPVLSELLRTIQWYTPTGLTPTAAALTLLKEELLSLGGKTYAFLLTDGAPNCNAAAACGPETCTPNLEGGCGFDDPAINCCDPRLGIYDFRWCLDADPTVAAVQYLADHGVKTFVIGMPGTDAYAQLLGRLASAGGTARDTDPKYYPVDSADELTSTLQAIGLSLTISCDVTLGEAPPDKHLVNVYFDQTLVPLDDGDGWTWTSDDAIRITGPSCDLLKGGNVLQLQVVAGCPSVTR